MISTFGNNIISAFTGGSSVKAIYTYGEQVWPSEPSYWYVSWTPTDASGSFSMFGSTYNLQDYSGYFSWSGSDSYSGYIPIGTFSEKAFTYMKTNVKSIQAAFTHSSGAFYGCSQLSQVSLPVCEYIGDAAFHNCSSLTSIDLPMCSYIGNGAFEFDSRLSQVSLPVCEYIGDAAFHNCSRLTSIDLPMCSLIDLGVFTQCIQLSQVSLPICEYISEFAFYSCSRLTSIYSPKCSYIDDYAFENCSRLTSINLPVCSFIAPYAFLSCLNLNIITLGSTSVCNLPESTAFKSTPIYSGSGSIYVPSSLVSAYQADSVWSWYSSIIYPINN